MRLSSTHTLRRLAESLTSANSLVSLQEELIHFSRTQEELVHPSSFTVCNLQAALDLLQEVEQRAAPPPVARAPASSRGWLPRMAPATNSENYHLSGYLQ